jgi:hypothetical protein
VFGGNVEIIGVSQMYCGVPPRGPLLFNGYASNSSLIGNKLNVPTAMRNSPIRAVA